LAVSDTSITDWATDFTGSDTNTPEDTALIAQTLHEEVQNVKAVVRTEEDAKGWIKTLATTPTTFINFNNVMVFTWPNLDLTSLWKHGRIIRLTTTSSGVVYMYCLGSNYNGTDTTATAYRMYRFATQNPNATGPSPNVWTKVDNNTWTVPGDVTAEYPAASMVLMRDRDGTTNDFTWVRYIQSATFTTLTTILLNSTDSATPSENHDRWEQYPVPTSAADITMVEFSSVSGNDLITGARRQVQGGQFVATGDTTIELVRSPSDSDQSGAFTALTGDDGGTLRAYSVKMTQVAGQPNEFNGGSSVGGNRGHLFDRNGVLRTGVYQGPSADADSWFYVQHVLGFAADPLPPEHRIDWILALSDQDWAIPRT
jgi:hypothetical protein